MKRSIKRQEYKATEKDLSPRSLQQIRKGSEVDKTTAPVVHRKEAPLEDKEKVIAKKLAVDFLPAVVVKKIRKESRPTTGISRQRRRQLELLAAGRCQSCGAKRAKGDDYYCKAHREAHNVASKRWYYNKLKKSPKTK